MPSRNKTAKQYFFNNSTKKELCEVAFHLALRLASDNEEEALKILLNEKKLVC